MKIKENICRHCEGSGEEIGKRGFEDCSGCDGTGVEIYNNELVFME